MTSLFKGGPTVNGFPPNIYPIGSQKYRIFKRLERYGRVKNIDVYYGLGGGKILNGTGRTSELRAYLIAHGWCLDCTPVSRELSPGVWEYTVKQFR
jgi:hypothetical protein